DPVPPHLESIPWGSGSPPSVSESTWRLGDRASASANPAAGSWSHRPSTARVPNVPADFQTNACFRWPRCPPPPPPATTRRKPWPPPFRAPTGAPPSRLFPCPTLRSVGSSDESHNRYTSLAASFVSSSWSSANQVYSRRFGGRCRHAIKPKRAVRLMAPGFQREGEGSAPLLSRVDRPSLRFLVVRISVRVPFNLDSLAIFGDFGNCLSSSVFRSLP